MIEYYTGRYDNVSGFAIDRTVMDSLLIKWLGGNYLDIMTWKEKAQKYDEIIKRLDKFNKVEQAMEWTAWAAEIAKENKSR
jgi:myo-inositol catabolism protein IolC